MAAYQEEGGWRKGWCCCGLVLLVRLSAASTRTPPLVTQLQEGYDTAEDQEVVDDAAL